MNDRFLQEMNELKADGVDFVPIFSRLPFSNVIQSNTKEEFKNNQVDSIPKTGYRYWQIVNGQKVYI